MRSPLKTGLALGSGAARGWSHIGVIRELERLGIKPDIVCGTSVGAMIGAAYVAGNLDRLEAWARKVSKLDVARFLDINMSMTGFVDTARFHQFLDDFVTGDGVLIESLPRLFAAVSTDLETGREVWAREGRLLQAVLASMSMPGLFPPVRDQGRWLVDGGLVNPVPVSVCRSLGADVVIAVNLNGDLLGRRLADTKKVAEAPKNDVRKGVSAAGKEGVSHKISVLAKAYGKFSLFDSSHTHQPPGMLDTMIGTVNIMQDRITRSRMSGDPPDIVFSPRLADIGLLELYRAEEVMEEGRRCVERKLPELEHVLGQLNRNSG